MESLIPGFCRSQRDSGYDTAAGIPESETVPVDPLLTPAALAVPEVQATLSVPVDPNQTLWTHQDTIFYILNTVNPTELEIVISGPTGHLYPVLHEARLSDRLAVTFRPLLPGTYELSVFIRGTCHVKGSPAHLNVSRDYTTVSRPIVSLDIHSVDTRREARDPWGLACNTKTEQLLVADRKKHEILVFGPDGDLNFRFGSSGAANGEFYRPTGIAYDATGDRILVSDKDNHRVQVFTVHGEFLSTFGFKGGKQGQFLFPWGLAVSPDGALIAVADSANHRVQVFDAKGKFLSQFRIFNGDKNCRDYKSQFGSPRGIVFSNSGTVLYVTDFNLNNVFAIDVDCISCVPVLQPGILKRPSGIVVDPAGNLVVADSKNQSLKVFKPDGTLVRVVDRIGCSQLEKPLDITLMKAGFLAILDLNGRVRVI